MSHADPASSQGRTEAQPLATRILIVDADRRVRAGLAGLLDLADHVEVVGTEGHARAALDACEACRPDAVVVDPRLPELPEGIAFIRGLRAHRPSVRVIVVAWAPALAALLADDPGISVVPAEGGDLAERIVEALRPATLDTPAVDGKGDARLRPTA